MNNKMNEKQEDTTFYKTINGVSFENLCGKLLSMKVKKISEYVDAISYDYSNKYDVGTEEDIVFYLQEFIDECRLSNTEFIELLCLGKHSPSLLYTAVFDRYGYKDDKTFDCLIRLANIVLAK